MVKRLREPSVEFTTSNDRVIANYNGKQYLCNIPVEEINKFIIDNTLDYDISQNLRGKSILSVENLRTNKKKVLSKKLKLLK